MSTTRKAFTAQIKAAGDRQVETVASTAALDRENDRILPTAWRLDAYRRNPVVLVNHDYAALPVARSVSIAVRDGKLVTLDEFPPAGVSPFADALYGLVKAGFVTAKSVGFRPLRSRPNDEGGRDYTDVELLEHSYVCVPANPEALVVARSKGLDRARLDAFLRGATRDLGDDIGLETIAADPPAALRGHGDIGLEAIDAERDVLAGWTATSVAALVRETLVAQTRAGLARVLNAARGRVD